MKHFNCKYCETTVSPRARTCPSCGEPSPANHSVGCLENLIRFLVICLIGVSFVLSLFSELAPNFTPVIYLLTMLSSIYLLGQLARG